MFKNIVRDFKITFLDFVEGVKKYPKTFVILLVLGTSFLSYSEITYNFIPHLKDKREIVKYYNMKKNPYRVKGNTLGKENADVVIDLYSDYVCPLCYVHNIMLHKAVKEFSNIKIIHHNFPFDSSCNKYLNNNMHPYACYMARGAISAKNQGNYWEMSSLLYENNPKKEEDMLKLAKKLNFDEKQFLNDMNSKETEEELQREILEAKQLKLDSTPTMIINGDKVVGTMPYASLKEVLIKHGAKRKKFWK